jgi:hypothetical protein
VSEPYLCSVRDAAHISRVPLSTLQRWVTRGLITDHSDGGAGLVDLEQVTELAATRRNAGRLPAARAQ